MRSPAGGNSRSNVPPATRQILRMPSLQAVASVALSGLKLTSLTRLPCANWTGAAPGSWLSHTYTALAYVAAAVQRPSGEIAVHGTVASLPKSSVFTASVVASIRYSLPSPPPAQSQSPAGPISTLWSASPAIRTMRTPACALTSQRRRAPSPLVQMCCPSAVKATVRTRPGCATNVARHCPVVVSNRRTAPRRSPIASRPPSGLKPWTR